MSKFKAFLERKQIKFSAKTYFIDAMGSMALGLFSTLLMGTILNTLGTLLKWEFLIDAANFAKQSTGIVLGIAIANTLKAPPLVMFSAGVVGLAGYNLGLTVGDATITAGPAGSFLVAIVAIELGKVVSKETHVDIIVTPLVTILSGLGLAYLVCPGVAWLMNALGQFINNATNVQPFLMGMIISAVVGVILTLPISSAAICAMIGISGLAGGAATAGCCAQMIGFAVISFAENKWSGLIAQGLGTSMLQMGNLIKKPVLWLAPTLASVITGPISTMVFHLENVGVNAGMGTCGLVGPLGIITTMENGGTMMWVGIALVCFILPAVLSLIFHLIMKKLGWVKTGDLKLDL